MTIRHYAVVVLLPIRHLVVMLPLLLSAACTDGAPVRPTTPVVDAVDFQLTGVVTDDDGTPMAGASRQHRSRRTRWILAGRTRRDESVRLLCRGFQGAARCQRECAWRHPLAQDPAALAWAYAPGCAGPLDEPQPGCAYDPDTRYIASNSPQVTQNFRLHRMTRVAAGQPATITVALGDRVCGCEVLESICRTVRIVAPSAGTMTVEAVPVGTTSVPARLYSDHRRSAWKPPVVRRRSVSRQAPR